MENSFLCVLNRVEINSSLIKTTSLNYMVPCFVKISWCTCFTELHKLSSWFCFFRDNLLDKHRDKSQTKIPSGMNVTSRSGSKKAMNFQHFPTYFCLINAWFINALIYKCLASKNVLLIWVGWPFSLSCKQYKEIAQ